MTTPKKTGPQGKGRPIDTIPHGWNGAIVQMGRAGRSLTDIRNVLKDAGHNISTKAISGVLLNEDESLTTIVQGAPKALGMTCGLLSPAFDEYREIVDDFILDGREPPRIRSYLVMEGFDIPIDELVTYCQHRKAELDVFATDPTTTPDGRRHHEHIRTLRRRLAEIWHHLPRDKRYSERMFAAVLAEYGSAIRFQLERVKDALEKDDTTVNDEIERKLGLVENGDVQDATDQDEPSGAEAPTGATV